MTEPSKNRYAQAAMRERVQAAEADVDLNRLAGDRVQALARWELARRSPVAFMRWFVWTADQHDQANPIKPFCWEMPYIQTVTGLWLWNSLLSVLKSRQMRMTWLFVILSLWDALFHYGRLIMLQSKREDDAIGDETSGDGLLGRAKFIMNHMPWRETVLPDRRLPDGRILRGYVPLGKRILFPCNNATLWAIPQGADIIRQRTASGILSDEAAFQPEISDSYTAARPCIRGGGWIVLLTTASLRDGGFCQRVHEDRLDAEE